MDDTHQEEDTVFQETMTASVEDSMAQKILKALDEHGEALKKMGGRLIRLEESKLKKSTHVEIHDDEEEVQEWDEKDKKNMKGKSNLKAHHRNRSYEGKDGENATRLS